MHRNESKNNGFVCNLNWRDTNFTVARLDFGEREYGRKGKETQVKAELQEDKLLETELISQQYE